MADVVQSARIEWRSIEKPSFPVHAVPIEPGSELVCTHADSPLGVRLQVYSTHGRRAAPTVAVGGLLKADS